MVKSKNKKLIGSISFEAVIHIDENKKTPAYIILIRYILVLMGAFGTIFCFLTSVEMNCNYASVAAATGIFCTLFSAIFMLKKKLSSILASLTMAVYLIIVFLNKMILINGMLNTANIYLATVKYYYRDNNYAELVFNYNVSQHTTIFLIAVAFLICFMLCWGIVYRTNIVLVFLTTFPVFELGMYYGLVPNYAFFIMLIACWGGVLSSEITEFSAVGSGWRYSFFKKVSSQGAAAVFAALVISFSAALAYVSFSGYTRPQKLDEVRNRAENYVNNFSVEKLKNDISSYNPLNKKSTGAINHGNLSKNGNISFNNETVLEVTMPKSSETVYLRGFTGTVYTGSSWKGMPEISANELSIIIERFKNDGFTPLLLNSYYWNMKNYDNISNIKVNNVSADKNYMYLPVNVTPDSVSGYNIVNDAYFKGESSSYSADYYSISNFMDYEIQINSIQSINSQDLSKDERLYRDFVYNTYLSVPEDFPAADVVFDDRYKEGLEAELKALHGGNAQLLYNLWYVKTWLKNNCSYSLNAGNLPFGKDFVTNFIVDTKKGSCSHFASAAVLLLRYQGIPARYAEGYIIKPSDFSTMKNEGEMDTVDVTDARGHAWVEVYIDGYGWYPFEVTSGYGNTRTEETTAISETGPDTIQSEKIQTETSNEMVTSSTDNTEIAPQHEENIKSSKVGKLYIVLLILAAAGAAIFAAVLRRYIILLNRRYRFSLSITNKAALYIYKYFKKILFFSGIEKGSETYEEFCRRIRQSSDLFDNDMSDTIINLALKANYSGQQVTDEAISEAVKAVQIITGSVYKSLKWYKKIVYKYLLCLI